MPGSVVAVMLVEQNAGRALGVATRAYVLEEGRIVAGGTPAALLAEPRTRSAYLGSGEGDSREATPGAS